MKIPSDILNVQVWVPIPQWDGDETVQANAWKEVRAGAETIAAEADREIVTEIKREAIPFCMEPDDDGRLHYWLPAEDEVPLVVGARIQFETSVKKDSR